MVNEKGELSIVDQERVDRAIKEPCLKVVKFSQGNKYLATGGKDGVARLYSLNLNQKQYGGK